MDRILSKRHPIVFYDHRASHGRQLPCDYDAKFHMKVGYVYEEELCWDKRRCSVTCPSRNGTIWHCLKASLTPCLNAKGPFFQGDIVFVSLKRKCNHGYPTGRCISPPPGCRCSVCRPPPYVCPCKCLDVGVIVRCARTGVIGVDFGYGGRDPEVLDMQRRDIRLAVKGPAHTRAEEVSVYVRPVAATCRWARDRLSALNSDGDRIVACCLAIVQS